MKTMKRIAMPALAALVLAACGGGGGGAGLAPSMPEAPPVAEPVAERESASEPEPVAGPVAEPAPVVEPGREVPPVAVEPDPATLLQSHDRLILPEAFNAVVADEAMFLLANTPYREAAGGGGAGLAAASLFLQAAATDLYIAQRSAEYAPDHAVIVGHGGEEAGQPHIKSLSHQYVISEAIIQCRPNTLLPHADLRRLSLQKIKCHMSNHSHIMRRIASTNPALVFPKCHIQSPVQLILDSPV